MNILNVSHLLNRLLSSLLSLPRLLGPVIPAVWSDPASPLLADLFINVCIIDNLKAIRRTAKGLVFGWFLAAKSVYNHN